MKENGSDDIYCVGASSLFPTAIDYSDPRKTFPFYENGIVAVFSDTVTEIQGDSYMPNPTFRAKIYGHSWLPGPTDGNACPNVVVPDVSSTIW